MKLNTDNTPKAMFRVYHKQDVQLLIQGKMQSNLFVVLLCKCIFFVCVNHSGQSSSLLSASAEAPVASSQTPVDGRSRKHLYSRITLKALSTRTQLLLKKKAFVSAFRTHVNGFFRSLKAEVLENFFQFERYSETVYIRTDRN